jgi:hypothetical protein
MRFPKIHTFLKWLGPSVILFCDGIISLIAALSEPFSRVNDWAERVFDIWWPYVSALWFLVCFGLLFLGYVVALVWTGGQSSKAAPITGSRTWGVLANEIFTAVAALPYYSPPNNDGLDNVGIALQDITARLYPRLAQALAEIKASRIRVPDELSRSPVNQFGWEQRAQFLLDSEQQLGISGTLRN